MQSLWRRASLWCVMVMLLPACTQAVQPAFTRTPPPAALPKTPVSGAPTSTRILPTASAALPTSTLAPPTSTPRSTLATSTAEAVPSIEVIVDNQDESFSTVGTWFTGDGGQSYDGGCAWAPRGIQNTAYVHPQLPTAGAYEVFAWWCGDPNHDQSQRARIEVYPTTGFVATFPVYVNLQEDAGRWNSLGTYYLERDASLSVDGGVYGNIVADAFRFVYRSSERVEITPTPLPTLIPWTTHPPSPLEQLTSGDLSARVGLVQRFYPYTPMVSMEEVSFDDCQAFPRDGCSGTRDGWRVQVQYQDVLVTYRVSQDYRFVSLEQAGGLLSRQLLYLLGLKGSYFFRVDRYPDDTWHLTGWDLDLTHASYMPLDAAMVEELRSFVHTYSSVTWRAPDGIELHLYGLGERVEFSDADRSRLGTLGSEFAAAVW
jgi:hypothetical protein